MIKQILLSSIVAAMPIALMAQGYHNPVIAGYHPDPSVCRVDSNFYLVNSSFEYFPAVPIYKSRDLVNWTLIGNVLDREEQVCLKGASSWLGIYAPTIRYHDGVYYMITTNVGNGDNFMVTAQQPEGPWSDPIWLSQKGIDPSLWFEDGRCYMVSNPDASIQLCEIDPATGRQLTPSRVIWRGTGGRHPEGPHIYKKDGYYYLLISEGGTELAHSLTIARSSDIYGPYESNPSNPLFTHCRMAAQSLQIQGTGHGDLVEAADGSWWIVMLGYRNFGGSYHHMGRETFLAPVEWNEGEWPVVNGGEPIDTLMHTATLPQQPAAKPTYSLDGKQLGPEWIYIQNPIAANYVHSQGHMTLKASASSLTDNNCPTFVGVRQEWPKFSVSVELDAKALTPQSEAGLTVYQIHNGHSEIFVRKNAEDGSYAIVVRHTVKSLVKESIVATVSDMPTKLTISSDSERYTFGYCYAGKASVCDSIDTSLLSTEVVGGFTGVTLGMYATGGGTADFSAFEVEY